MNFVFTFIRLFCAFFIFVVIGGCVSHSTIYGDFIAGKSLSTPSGVLWFRSRDFISDAKTPLELSAINLPAKVDPMEISVGISGGTNTPHESSGIFKIEVLDYNSKKIIGSVIYSEVDGLQSKGNYSPISNPISNFTLRITILKKFGQKRNLSIRFSGVKGCTGPEGATAP